MKRLIFIIVTPFILLSIISCGCCDDSETEWRKTELEKHFFSMNIYGNLADGSPLNWSGEPDEFFTDAKVISLIRAISEEDLDKIKEAIRAGANINQQGKYGVSPLLWAMCMKKKKLYEYLLQKGADSALFTERGHATLHFAAICESDSYWLEMALRHGADPDLKHRYSAIGTKNSILPDGATTLFMAIACIGSSRRNIQLLIDAGADLDRRFKMRESPDLINPLKDAAFQIRYDFMHQLLEAGADHRPDPKNGIDIYFFAVSAYHLSPETERGKWRLRVVEFLEKEGVDLDPTKKKVYEHYKNRDFFMEDALSDPVLGPWLRKRNLGSGSPEAGPQ